MDVHAERPVALEGGVSWRHYNFGGDMGVDPRGPWEGYRLGMRWNAGTGFVVFQEGRAPRGKCNA